MKNGSIVSQSTRMDLGLRERSQPGEAQHCPATVAQPKRETGEQLVTSEVTNFPNYNEWLFKLLLLYDENVGVGSAQAVEEFFKKINRITPKHIAVAQYIRLHTVTVPSLIIEELGVPEGTIYRILKNLKKWGAIKYSGSINHRRKKGVKGGPQPEIISWAQVKKIPPEQIADLTQRYYGSLNPAMKEVNRLIPMLISEYVSPQKEIKYLDIVKKVKQELPGYHPTEIAEEVARNLHHEGIKVWR